MKVILCTLLLVIQVGILSAHERFGFKIKQENQERIVKEAYADGRLSEHEYLKLMHQQEVIKESIATADLDNNWTALEHNTVLAKLKRAEKKLKKYERNTER